MLNHRSIHPSRSPGLPSALLARLRPRGRRLLPWVLATGAAGALLPSLSFAAGAVWYWTGNGNANLQNGPNWANSGFVQQTGNVLDFADGEGTGTANGVGADSLVFPSTETAYTSSTGAPLTFNTTKTSIAINAPGGLDAGVAHHTWRSITFEDGTLGFTIGPLATVPFVIGDSTDPLATPDNTGFITNHSTATQTFNQPVHFRFGGVNADAGPVIFQQSVNVGHDLVGATNNLTVDGSSVVLGQSMVTINGALTGLGTDTSLGGAIIKNGTGTLVLNGNNSAWNGRILINDGGVLVGSSTALGSTAGRTTIAGGSNAGRINFSTTGPAALGVAENLYLEGRAATNAPHAVNVAGETSLTGTITLDAGGLEYGFRSDAGLLTVAGPVSYGTAAGPTNLRLSGAGNGVVASSLGASEISVVKDGAGTWSLTGTNAYTGATTVNAGQLIVSATQTGGGDFTVNDLATLGVKLSSTGQSLVTSTLTLGSATGGILTLDLGDFASTTVPAITSGVLTTTGTNTVTVTATGLSVAAYPLIGYSGTIQGDGFAGLALANLPPRVTANLLNDTVNKKVLLNITQFDIPRWTGAVNGNWDINNSANPATGSGTPNWRELNSGNATRYLQTAGAVDSVLFDDTATGTTDVVLAANVSPVTLTVKNTNLIYSFNGLGKITGATNVVKQDPGTWIIANTTPNDYTGSTTISGGVVQIGDGLTPGGGSFGEGGVTNNASIVLLRAPGETYPFSTNIGGTGSLTKSGDNTAVVSGVSSFDGAVTVTAGTLKLGSNTALGSTLAGTTVQSGATLDVGDFKAPTSEVVTISGTGVTAGGALVSTGPVGGTTAGLGSLALAADATIGGTKRFDVRDGTLAGSGFALTKVGINNIHLANLGETQLGNIVLNVGRLTFEGTTTLGAAPGTVQIDVNGELGLENSTVTQTKAVALNGGKIVFSAGTTNTLAGPVTLAPAVTNTIQGPGSGVAVLTISGNVDGGALTKTQAGTLILSGTNTYTGGTTISEGGVLFPSLPAVPSAGTITLGPGSTVGFGFLFDQSFLTNRVNATPNPATLALGVDNSNTFDFATYSGLSLGATGTVVYSGTLTPAGTSAGGAYRLGGGGGALTYNGALSGNNTLNIGSGGSSGTVTLTGANSHVGRTTIAGLSTLIVGNTSALGATTNPLTVDGTLDLNGFDTTVGGLTAANTGLVTDNSVTPGTTVFTDNIASGSSTFSGSITNGANGRVIAFVKAGAGTVVMNKANGNTYTGGTTLAGGRLDIRTNAAQVLPNGSNLTFTGNATFAPSNNGNGNVTLTLGSLAFNGGEGTIESNNFNGGTGSQNTVFTAAPTRAAGATGNFIVANNTTPTALPSPATYRVTFTTAPATGQSLDGGVFFGGDNFAAYNPGTGYVRALDYVADTNALNLPLTEDLPAFGISATGRDVQVSGTGFNITNQTTDTIRTLKIASASNVTLNDGATLTISAGGLLKTGASAATIDGGDGLTTGGAGDLVVRTAAATDTLTIATNLLASSTGGLTKAGSGVLILSGTNNAFTGGLWVNGGSLRFASLAAVPATGPIRLNTSTTVSFGHAFDQAFLASYIPATATSATIALGTANSNDLDFSAVGANYAALSLGASGTFTYSGTLTPNSNVYRLGGGGGTLTYSGVLGGDNALVVNGGGSGGTVTLPAANTYTGGTTIVSGTLRLGNAAALGTPGGTVTLTGGTLDLRGFDQVLTDFSGGNGTLTDNTPSSTATTTVTTNILSGTRTFAGSINNGTGGRVLRLVKDGPGTLILTKANGSNYTGGTVLNNGRLEIRTNAAQVLPNGSNVTVTGTSTLAAVNNGAATVTTAGLTLGTLTLTAGDAIIESNQLNASTTNTLTFAASPTRAAGATGNFTLSVATDPALYKVVFTSAPTSGQSVNGGLFYNYTDFLTYDAGGFARGLHYAGTPDSNAVDVPLSASQPTLGTSLAGKDVQLSGASGLSITEQASETLRSLKIATDASIVLGGSQTLTIDGGGLLKTGGSSATISGGAGLTTGGTADLVARVDFLTDTLTIATPIQSTTTGGVTKTGQGTLVLGAFNEYSGPTTVNAGTVVLSGSINGSTSVLVNRGGTLSGTGTITTAGHGNVTVASGGSLSPGLSAGTLHLQLGTGQLDLSAVADGAGWLKYELGTFSDSIELATGTLNIGTGLDLDDFSFSDSGGFGTGTYTLFDSGTDILGALGLNFTGTVLGYEATLAFAGGVNGHDDLVLLVGAPVPEPGALLSLLTGALVLARRCRPAKTRAHKG